MTRSDRVPRRAARALLVGLPLLALGCITVGPDYEADLRN